MATEGFLKKILKFLQVLFYQLLMLPRDLRALFVLKKIEAKTKELDKRDYSVPDYFSRWLRSQPNKPCIIYNDKTWTFQDMENYGNKVANVFREKLGLKKGDVVALFMHNQPEFVGIWFGLSKIGVATALINTNLTGKTLFHSVEIAKPKVLVFGDELSSAVEQVEFSAELRFVCQGSKQPSSAKVLNLESLLENASDVLVNPEKMLGKDVLMYIYTSGTTGLPKPAIIKHNRYLAGGFSFFHAAGCTTKDVFYVCLPIYHSNAGCMGIGAAMVSGATVVLKKKFSATNFWFDCIKYNVSAFTYVGEVCRYLVNQPASPLDRTHKVRVCIGNGTRINVHKEFSQRFNIKCIEIYGATEGNCILMNIPGKYGACGFVPPINRYITVLPTFVIKIDSNFEPVRDSNGFCVACEPGERGLVVGVIKKSTKSDYSGYANSKDASEKKIINDLFKKGQNAFNTGDMLMTDKYGWVYFVDRLGDTFRWRGENVSTVEVENAISARLNSKEVVVYGVQVGGQEGKAGMATIMALDVDVQRLGEHLKTDLPSYAKPLFIRLSDNVEHTGSLKAQKSRLMNEAFNVNLFSDKTFYYDAKTQSYSELNKETYEKIQNNSIRM